MAFSFGTFLVSIVVELIPLMIGKTQLGTRVNREETIKFQIRAAFRPADTAESETVRATFDTQVNVQNYIVRIPPKNFTF